MVSSLPTLVVATSLVLGGPASTAASPRPPHPSTAKPQACATDAREDSARAQSMFNAGLGLTISGLAVGLIIGGPALLLRRNARQDAARATYEARQRRYARRADRREVVAFSAIGVGGVMILVGIPLMIAGSRSKNESRASVSPILSPTMAGLNAQLRF